MRLQHRRLWPGQLSSKTSGLVLKGSAHNTRACKRFCHRFGWRRARCDGRGAACANGVKSVRRLGGRGGLAALCHERWDTAPRSWPVLRPLPRTATTDDVGRDTRGAATITRLTGRPKRRWGETAPTEMRPLARPPSRQWRAHLKSSPGRPHEPHRSKHRAGSYIQLNDDLNYEPRLIAGMSASSRCRLTTP